MKAAPQPAPSLQILHRAVLFVGCVLTALCSSGCQRLLKSRWAMDDPVYEQKYEDGAKKTDVLGKIKQASDARFQSGKSGYFVSGGYQQIGPDTMTAGIQGGFEFYPTSYFTSHSSLMLFGGVDDLYTGADLGVRFQSPTRIAPFIGAGTFHGFARESVRADDDGIDNDEDGWIDERREEERVFSGWISSIYPEVGCHTWLTSDIRLSLLSRYLITTEGRDVDQWWVGASIAVFSR